MRLENLFPLTKNCYKKGINRCAEPVDLDEQNVYCGPQDRPCIDCYIPLSLICIPFDILTCCMMGNPEKDKIVGNKSNEDTIKNDLNEDTRQNYPKITMLISYV